MIMVVCRGCCAQGLLAQFRFFPTISVREYCGGGLKEYCCAEGQKHFCNTYENFRFHREHMQLLICFIVTSCVSVSCNSVDFNKLHEVTKFW